MKKRVVKKLELSKETVSLMTASVVGGAITNLCAPTNPIQCPTNPAVCQSGKYPC